ncbi:hypothetical protein L2Y94_02600 [Luteibacter aegosomatis]|uniref:hypothetical protein n=1 Tax=Luteibacter aegosomatis TaxID=2911537 RepID=UPI001FF978FF|nr:hypothetical protein [Luteibacter aegosomatis]UPG86274.1 hypothetical protein L2Y94_02600 [Luteibacter aegosomatis]
MNHTFALSIAVTSLAAFGAVAQPAYADTTTPPAAATPTASHGGKCASGKCGTEKIYSKASIQQDPQDRLVRARDGKCGLTAQGHDAETSSAKKLAEGVCGQ